MKARYPHLAPAISLIILFLAAPVFAAELPIQQMDQILGRKAQQAPAEVYKYSWPRSDLHVRKAGVSIEPGLALGSWAGFKQMKTGEAMVMGDLVLLDTEVNPVVAALQAHKISVSAVHNHLIGETPRVLYVHYMGMGAAVDLAKGLRESLEKSKTPLETKAPAKSAAEPAWANDIANALSRKGKMKGKLFAVEAPRSDTIKINGEEIPAAMGLATTMNFQSVGTKVASTGDFVLESSEVNPVITALQQHGIEVQALHSHMLDDEPRLFFMHYWALGDPAEVGAGLKAALEKMAVKPGE